MNMNIGIEEIKELTLYALKILAGAILTFLFPGISVLFFYGINHLGYSIAPNWVTYMDANNETLVDNWIGGLMTICFAAVIIAIRSIWLEYKSQVTHETRRDEE